VDVEGSVFCDVMPYESHKPCDPLGSVTWLQLLGRRMNTGTTTPLWLQKHAYLRAHDFVHSTDFWFQPRLANIICTCSWVLSGINPAIPTCQHMVLRPSEGVGAQERKEKGQMW